MRIVAVLPWQNIFSDPVYMYVVSKFPFLKERVIAAKMPAKNAKSLFVPSNQKTVHLYPIKGKLYVPKIDAREVIKVSEFNSGVDLIELVKVN